MKTAIAAVLTCLDQALAVVLLVRGFLTGNQYLALFSVIVVAGLALHADGRLRVLDLRNLKLILDKAEEVRDSIYATEEDLHALVADLAESYLTAALDTPRVSFECLEVQREMLAKRDRARALLKRAGLSEQEIGDRVAKVTGAVAWDLVRAVRDRVQWDAYSTEYERERGYPPPIKFVGGDDDPELNRLLDGKNTPDEVVLAMEEYIRHKKRPVEDYRERLEILRAFIEHETLPPGEPDAVLESKPIYS